jgi:integrase
MTIPGGLLTRAPKIIYRPKAVAEALNLPAPEGPAWIADLASVATFLDSLQPSDESIRRWTILLVAFACRPEAALEAGPFQFNATERTIRLNPLGRRPNKKFRPTIPVADSLLPLLAEWSTSEQYTGFSAKNYPTKRWRTAVARAGLPDTFTPRAIRHMMATELRHAHKRYGVPRVPRDEIEMFMGHRRATTNSLYGAFEPDYLDAAKTAVDAVLHALNAACQKPFLRQVSAKSGRSAGGKTRLKAVK